MEINSFTELNLQFWYQSKCCIVVLYASLTFTLKALIRPSYDDLTMSQWVSSFVRCIQEEKSEAAKSSMLDYLCNLMEDASDFSWESAKASHAIILTNM